MSTPPTHRLSILALLLVALSPFAVAQTVNPADLRPQLSDIDSFFRTGPAFSAPTVEEPQWVRAGRPNLANLQTRDKVRTLPGLGEYDTSKAPMRHNWWNYPLYAVLGAPRDAIDGFFGTLGMVPILNIPTTGAMYEFVPTQVLMRNYRDWHRWPGRRNAKGHGWLDGTWGWFSNYHHTTFSSVDQAKLDRWEAHNREVKQKIAAANAKIEEENAVVKERRLAFRRETRQMLRDGKYREVIIRMVAYREADPLSNPSRAMLVSALIAGMPTIPERDWVNRTLGDIIWGSSRAVLVPVREEVRYASATRPDANALRYLIAINVRLENYAQAMDAAHKLIAMNPADLTAQRLQFEVALAGRDTAVIEAAAKDIEKVAGADSAAALDARGRQALLAGQSEKAAQLFTRAIALEPLNSRFRYLEAMSLIETARRTGKYDKAPVLKELEKAVEYARSTEEGNFYRETLKAADDFTARKPRTTKPEPPAKKTIESPF